MFILFCFDIKLYELFISFEYQLLVSHTICKYFLPFSRLTVSFPVQKFLSLSRSYLLIFAFVFFAKNIAVVYVKECSAYVFF